MSLPRYMRGFSSILIDTVTINDYVRVSFHFLGEQS